ncbi:aldehyde dehydrogenase family protein [Planctomonas sp. JC2975]|nr:aldehyde dehydrogenase family protein [Planctomonas sp. JC2975]
MRIAREAIVGPAMSAIPFDGMDDLGRSAKADEFRLGRGIWTRDVGKAHSVAKAFRTCMAWVSCYGLLDPAVPFGGYRMCGYGCESRVHHLDGHLEVRSVMIRTV